MIETFDLRDPGLGNVISPPREQGDSRQCIAFALAATVEGRIRFRDRQALGLAPDDEMELDVDDFLRVVGPSESLMVHRNAARKRGLARVADPSGPRFLPRFRARRGVPRMQAHLKANGPLLVTMWLYDNFQDFVGPGLYVPEGRRLPEGHAVSIIGYSGESREPGGHWILKNSYGTDWGDGGFFRVPYRLWDLEIENSAHVVTAVRLEDGS